MRSWRGSRNSMPAVLGFLGGLLVTSSCTASWAQAPAVMPPPGGIAVRVTDKIVLDGKLDEPTWKNATPVPLDLPHPFKEGAKLDKPAGFARLAWDDENLYVAFEVFDTDVRAAGDKRDAASINPPHDAVEVFMDVNNDSQHFIEVHVNPLNTFDDLFILQPAPDSPMAQRLPYGIMFLQEWNMAKYETAVQVQGTLNDPQDKDTGWTAEFCLPFKSLLLPLKRPRPQAGDVWRMQLAMINGADKAPMRLLSWAPSRKTFFHQSVEAWGRVTFAK